MYSSRSYGSILVCFMLIYLPKWQVSAQAHLYCQNCFYGPQFCEPNSQRCIYGCREGWKGGQCLDQCITKGCKHCEVQRNGIEQCTSCLLPGMYGPLCNLRCSSTCKRYGGDDVCDHFGNCIYGCVAPYIGNKCEEQDCEFDNCIQCAMLYNHITCHQCRSGYYWIPTIQKCVPCTSNCRYGTPDCDQETGQCKSGQCSEGWLGQYCNIPCDIEHCSACKENNRKAICVTCEKGYFPNPSNNRTSCIPCSSNCGQNCNRQTGQCLSGCTPGFYGGNCDLQCQIPNCDECAYDDPNTEDQVLCTKCSNGYFYYNTDGCEPCPANCQHGGNFTCQFIGGYCLNGCNGGWYGPTCEERCSENCVNGVCNSIGSCNCVSGWFGHRCDRSCPIHCLHCNEYVNGVCGGCEAGWYGQTCDQQCSLNCQPNTYSNYIYCNKETGYCREGCKPDWYGQNCTMKCSSSCIGSNCDRDTGDCILGCIVNKYGTICDQSCPAMCKNPPSSLDSACNSTNGRCLYGCSGGFYGPYCNLSCSKNCFEDECDIITGNCLKGCDPGFSGLTCDQRCTGTCPTACGSNCLYDLCDAVSKTCTAGCHQGWYGGRCEKICSDTCLNRICEQNTGNCKDGCIAQHYGLKCDQLCSDTCLIKQCRQTTGYCEDCMPGYYGLDCKNTCPTDCMNSTCHKLSGYCFRCGVGRHGDFCTQGCLPGYYGENCETECGHCKDGGPCYIYDGFCPSGCDIGWTGMTCNQAHQTSDEPQSNPNNAMQIAIGCAVGGVFCCLVIVAVVCWYRKRKQGKNKKVEEPSVHFRNAQVVISSTSQPQEATGRTDSPGDQTSNQSSASEHSQSDPLLGDPQGPQIKLLDLIHQGHFYSLVKGEVIRQGTKEQCVVKLLKLKELKDERYIYRLTLETEILAQCGSHKNIVSLIKTYQNTDNPSFYDRWMDKCSPFEELNSLPPDDDFFVSCSRRLYENIVTKGEIADIYCVAFDNCIQTGLLSYLRRMPFVSNENGSLSLDPVNIYKITQFVTEICSAVSHIHDLKVIHRALRAGHVYLSRNYVTKLGDFDWAEFFHMDHTEDTVSHRFDLPKNYFHWLCPESCMTNEFSLKSDVWSLGLIFWEVFNLARKSPFSGLNREDHRQAIKDGIRPSKPPLAHFSLYRLMKSCWRYDPADRPSSHQVLSQLQTIQASTLATAQQLEV